MRYQLCGLGGLGISMLLAACGSSPQAVQPGQSSAVASQSSSAVVPLNEPITVTVTDLADNPISNAVVRAVGTSVTAQSDSAGHAYLMGLSPGDYKVRVDANGYYSDVTETSPGGDVHFLLDWAPPTGIFTFKDSAYLIWVVLTVHQDLSLVSLFEIGEYEILVSSGHSLEKGMGLLFEDRFRLRCGLASVDSVAYQIQIPAAEFECAFWGLDHDKDIFFLRFAAI